MNTQEFTPEMVNKKKDYASNQSSDISSVKITDYFNTERSEETPVKASKVDMFANRFQQMNDSDQKETAREIVELCNERGEAMIQQVGVKILSKVLDQANVVGHSVHNSIKDAVSNKYGKQKFTIDSIMQMIDADKLRMLRGKFLAKQKIEEDGFSLNEFVNLMRNVIPYDHPSEETDLVLGLSSLFREIDINGNGYMEWDEFTGFLIEAVDQKQLSMAGTLASDEIVSQNAVAQHILHLEESQPDYLHQNNMLQVARSQIYQEFHPSSTFKDTLVRNSPIIDAVLYHGTDTFITLEQNSKCVKHLTAMSNQAIPGLSNSTTQATRVTQKVHLPLLGPSYILSVAFNEKDKIMALCSTDSLIYFYRCFGNQRDWKLFKIICSHGITCQVNMWYMPHHERWFSIGSQQQGNYSKKQINVGSIQTLQQWHIPRSKLLSNRQMHCPDCQTFWNRSRGNQVGANETGEHQIERPYVDEFDMYGNRKVNDTELRYLVEPFEHMNHRDDVKDVKEIFHPYLAIITACHDGKLRIISTKLRRAVGILHTGHTTGIRQIDYTPYHGASILSVGYECYFNLWEMDNSLSFGKQMQDQPTKFTLVSSPCIAARFLGQSVFAVAIDSLFTVKIWNYKKNLPMQSLQQTSLKMQDTITGLLTFSEGKFAVLSKHVTFYDTIGSKLGDNGDGPQIALKRKELEIRRMILQEKGLSEIQQAANQQRNSMINPPLDVQFLESYQNFLVLTKDSLRVYNGNNGRLRMYLDNIVETEERSGNPSELTCMCLNSENRMVYIGDIHGGIRCFNVNTGLQIKKLELPPGMLRKQGEASVKINKEVCGMRFFTAAHECELLLSAHWNNRIRIWDVIDVEKAQHMRSASAQEVFNEDIQCTAVSEHLSLIATGSMLGNIVVWDFELFKVEGVLVGSKLAIVALEFVKEYPLLVSASMCGIVSVYAVRGGPRRIKNHCLGRFVNTNFDYTLQRYVNTPITSMTLQVRTNKRFNINEKTSGILAQNVSYFSMKKRLEKANQEVDINFYTKAVYQARLAADMDEYIISFNTGSTMDTSTKGKPQKAKTVDPEEGTFKVGVHEELYEKYYPPFNNRENPEFLNVVISDEAGNIKYFDLTTFIRKPQGQPPSEEKLVQMQKIRTSARPPCLSRAQRFSDSSMSISSHLRKKIGTMPGRRMDLKAGSPAVTQLEDAKKNPLPPLLVARKCVVAKIHNEAHKGRINQIRCINIEPYGFVTCGNDKFVRIWSQWGSKVGEINLIKEGTNLNNWRFGFDWQQKRKEQQSEAAQIVEELANDMELTTIQEKKEEDGGHSETASVTNQTIHTELAYNMKQNKELMGNTFITSIGGGPALKCLVDGKPPDSEDEEEALILKTFRLKDDIKRGVRKQKDNSKSQESDKWDVDKMFPIPSKHVAKPGEFLELQKQMVKQQTKQIDKAFKLNLPSVKNPFNKRKPQSSQQVFRQKKSNLKNSTGMKKLKNMQKSQISFQIDEMKEALNTESNTKGLNSIRNDELEPQVQQRRVASSESSKSKEDDQSYSSDSTTGQQNNSQQNSENQNQKKQSYQSKADRKLELKYAEMNTDPFTRLDQIMRDEKQNQLSSNRAQSKPDTNSRSGSQQLEKASAEAKSLQTYEAKLEKQSQQSLQSMGNLKEQTDRGQAAREKLQENVRAHERRMSMTLVNREQILEQGQNSRANSRNQKIRTSITVSTLPTLTKPITTISTIPDLKHQVVDDVNQKTDDHLKELIVECTTRHEQMQSYIDIMKAGPNAIKRRENQAILQSKIALSSPHHKKSTKEVANQAQKVLNNIVNISKESPSERMQSDRASQRPPRMRPNQSLQQLKTRNSIANESQRMGVSKNSRFLNRVDKYINESGSNPALDQRFFMREKMRGSHSLADLHSNSNHQVSMSQMNVSQSNKNLHPNTDGYKKTGPNRFLPIKLKAKQNWLKQTDTTFGNASRNSNKSLQQLSRPQSRHKDDVKVRDVQRLIAHHVSQKQFSRPGSVSRLQVEDQIVQQPSQNNAPGHREQHLKDQTSPKPKSRVAKFLSQYTHQKEDEAAANNASRAKSYNSNSKAPIVKKRTMNKDLK